jgi:filamentous hemagglutinin
MLILFEAIHLPATKDVNILASADTESNRSSNSSSSTSVGVSVGIGSGGAGLSLDLAASRGKGQANSDSTTYNNSHITGGNAVNVTSGADTNVVGGNIKATQVTADVGGNLNVQSLQDIAVSEASQKTTGIALSIPIVGTGGSASFSQSKQNSNSNYASVNEQSGIQAGDGGFQVNVKGNTDLKGATIASSDKATQDEKNSLTTNTLTTSDIMSASASSSGVSVGTNMMDGKYAMGKAIAGNALNNGSANQSDASTTTSAISAGNITVGGKTTDTSKATLTDSNGKTVSTDTSNTSRALAKADVAGLQKSAQDQQAGNMLAFNAVTAFTDEAYRTMYKAGAQIYRMPPGCSDKSCAVPLTEQEAMALKTSPQDGKVHLSNNGIFNDLDGAVKYAQQHGGTMNEDGSKNYSDKPENQYIIFAPQANNVLSELIIAGVQKSGATPTVGLTNAEEQTAKIVQQAAQQGQSIVIDSHSRGTLTTDNALQSINNQDGIKDESGNTIKPNIQMNNYGGAQSNDTGNQTLQQVTGNKDSQINSVVHPNDFIGTVIGGNQATPSYISTTNGTKTEVTSTSDGKDPISNVVNTMTGTITPHNCYGTASKDCQSQWSNIPESNIPNRTNPDYKAPVVIPQYQQVDKVAPQVQQDSNTQMNQLLQPIAPLPIPIEPTPPNSKLETIQNFKKGL